MPNCKKTRVAKNYTENAARRRARAGLSLRGICHIGELIDRGVMGHVWLKSA
jgi:hypothetical protein